MGGRRFPPSRRPPTVPVGLRYELRRAGPETSAELHQRAAGWYADHAFPVEAARLAERWHDLDGMLDAGSEIVALQAGDGVALVRSARDQEIRAGSRWRSRWPWSTRGCTWRRSARSILATVRDEGPHLGRVTAHRPLITRLLDVPSAPTDPLATGPALTTAALSDRERVVLRYLRSRLSAAEIADELYVSVHTVKTHMRHIYRKVQATSRREAADRTRALDRLNRAADLAAIRGCERRRGDVG